MRSDSANRRKRKKRKPTSDIKKNRTTLDDTEIEVATSVGRTFTHSECSLSTTYLIPINNEQVRNQRNIRLRFFGRSKEKIDRKKITYAFYLARNVLLSSFRYRNEAVSTRIFAKHDFHVS